MDRDMLLVRRGLQMRNHPSRNTTKSIAPRFARHFYLGSPRVPRRAAAPVLFALLSVACFEGVGLPALIVLTFMGLGLVAYNRRNPPQASPSERLKQHY